MASAEKRATETRVEYIVSDVQRVEQGAQGGGGYMGGDGRREADVKQEMGGLRRKAKTGRLPAWAS